MKHLLFKLFLALASLFSLLFFCSLSTIYIRVWNMKCPASSRWLTSGPASPGSKRLSRLTSGICLPLLIKSISYSHVFVQTFNVWFFHQFNRNFVTQIFSEKFPDIIFMKCFSIFLYFSLAKLRERPHSLYFLSHCVKTRVALFIALKKSRRFIYKGNSI